MTLKMEATYRLWVNPTLKTNAFDFGEPKKKNFQHDVNRAIALSATTPPVLGVYGPTDANGFPGTVCDSPT